MNSLLDRLRTLLILGRVSNLPTVWSNLTAGWIFALDVPLSDPLALGMPLFSGSLFYVGGMYLNDFCDADFDARYCPWRPIPSGKISRSAVGVLAALWFAAGIACLIPFGWPTVEVGLLLLAAIVLYDFRHKGVSWAPLVMGLCRFLLYPLAASFITSDFFGRVCFWAAMLGLYVAGITYLARGESHPVKPTRWALLLLLFPTAMSVVVYLLHQGFIWHDLPCALPLFGLLLLIWMAWLLIPLWRKTNPSIGRVVSGLLAGIVLVDAIAAARVADFQAAWFLIFFALALLLQRVIPAT